MHLHPAHGRVASAPQADLELMGLGWEFAIVIAAFLGLLVAGMTIPFAITVPALLYLVLHGGPVALKGLGLVSWGSMDSFTLTAIPLFILMAEILQESRLSLRVYRGLARLVGTFPGGLLQTNIVGCALFAAISGSSVVTAASIGRVALPELLRRGYNRPMAAGSLAAGGTLGILMPPSIAMIVYGTFTETSVAKLFMAGVVPGLLLTVMFMGFVGVYAWFSPAGAPAERGAASLAEFATAVIDVVPFGLLIACTIGSIYAGLVTPTEAAAVGCILGLVISAIWGELSWAAFTRAIRTTVGVVGNILFIIFAAYVFSYAISLAGVGEQVTNWLIGLHLSRPAFFFALFVLYTVLGCLVESLGMIVITLPLLFPILSQYGIDPVWFGVILVVFIELGQISPPIGINLFVIQSIWDGKLGDVVRGTIPFHLLMLVLLLLLFLLPDLALWLPAKMTAMP